MQKTGESAVINGNPSKESQNPTVNRTMTDVSVNVCKGLIAAAGFNVETPIVNALIGNLTGTLPTRKSDVAEPVKCDICNCEISPNVSLVIHINGSKHKKRLKALNIISQIKAGGEKGIYLGDGDNPKEIRCEVCCLTVNSPQQLEFHLCGAKHKKNAAKAGGAVSHDKDAAAAPPPKKIKSVDSKFLNCNVCNIMLNSQAQYNQHLTSKKHMSKKKHKPKMTG